MNRKATRFLALAGALAPSLASATLLINDGGTHSILAATAQSVLVDNGSELRIAGGGSITGDGTNTSSSLARGALSAGPLSNSTIRLSDSAQVFAGSDQYAIARSLGGRLYLSGDSQVHGGIFGFATTSPPTSPTLRTYLSDNAVVNGNVDTDGLVSLSGNSLITGHLFENNGGIALEMNGGTIQGRVSTSSLVGHSALINDGAILGGYGGNASNIDFSIHGGLIDGGWSVYSQDMLVELRGGQINGGMLFGSIADPNATGDRVSIFSGAIDATAGGWLLDFASGFDFGGATSFDCSANTTRFDIWGGQLGGSSAGNGIRLDYCATLDVYGTGLSYSGGWLTGLLADGSLLNVAVSEVDRWGGAIRLHDVSVPEPGTLGLLGLALGAMAMTRRRRAQANS
ncbi:MAG TPA: PEP-CTERM sorting domain-containing protein [Steroidobacteraceae bacterium]